MAEQPAAAGPGPSDSGDATRVDTPGLHDDTAVYRPPAPEPAPQAPWQPAQWAPPAPPPAPGWQTPPGPPQQSGHPGQQSWGAPPPGPPQWGPAPAPSPPAAGGNHPSLFGGLVAILGAILVVVGVFTPWIGNNQDDPQLDASGWDLAGGDKALESTDPYVLLALAVAALAVGTVLVLGVLRPVARIAAVVVGLVVIAIMVRDWMTIADAVTDQGSDFEITAQFGFYLAIAGGVVTALASLLPAGRSR